MKADSNIKRVKVLGVGIDDVTMEEGLEIVEKWLTSIQYPVSSRLVFTPGPEFLVTAQSDPEFKKILNSADLNIPDGYGLKIFGNITNIIPGVDFMLALCKLAQKKSFTVGLLGGTMGVAKKTKDKLETMFPGIKITFAIDGEDADRVVEEYEVLRYVDILFVALGHPKQEKYLSVILVSTRSARIQNPFCIGMGVGGSFDFISGKVPQPEAIYNSMGLKWLGRFLTRPGYMLPKIIKAVIIFPLLIIKKRLQGHFP